MKNLIVLFILILGLLVSAPSQAPQDASSCAVVQQALNEMAHLKVGMQRKDVEKDFTVDGGMSFRSPTTYVDRKCGYIKVDVEFNFDPAIAKDFAPTDKIIKISRLYIDYPVKD